MAYNKKIELENEKSINTLKTMNKYISNLGNPSNNIVSFRLNWNLEKIFRVINLT